MQNRKQIIKDNRQYISVQSIGQSGYGRKDCEITIDKRFPLMLTQNELIDLSDLHHYGGYASGTADCGDYLKYQVSVYID